MGEVVLAKEQLRVWDSEAFLNVVLDPQLVTQPRHHRLAEYAIGVREGLDVGEQKAFEFDERLLEKDDIIQICRLYPTGPQAEVNRMLRKLVVVFLPSKPLLLGRSDKLTLAEQRGGSIVEVTGNAKDIHQDCLLACSIATLSLASLSLQPRDVLGFNANGSLCQRRAMATGPIIKK
jgi:hypothetical protein